MYVGIFFMFVASSQKLDIVFNSSVLTEFQRLYTSAVFQGNVISQLECFGLGMFVFKPQNKF